MIMSIEINNDLLVAIIGVLSALLVAMITFMGVWYQLKKTEVNTLKAKLRDKQEIVYDKIYSYIFDLLNDTITKRPLDKVKYANRYMEIKKLLLFHASDRVVLQFIKLILILTFLKIKHILLKYYLYLISNLIIYYF